MADIECNFFDREEIHPDCTVQVLTNTVTGEVSVGWFENKWIDVNERLPQDFGYEDSVDVLVLVRVPEWSQTSNGSYYICRTSYRIFQGVWDGDEWRVRTWIHNTTVPVEDEALWKKVVAWRPLPEVPEEWRSSDEG